MHINAQYGVALLRNVEEREENGDVFGDRVPREIATGAAPKPKASASGEGSSSEGSECEGQEEEGEEGKSEEEEEEGGEEEGNAAGEVTAEETGDGDVAAGGKQGVSAEGATDDLEIAFEVLDCARVIMEKEDDESEKLGDVFGFLGDVNLRNEQVCMFVCVCVA